MRLLHEQIREIERERLRRLPVSTVPAAEQGAHAMIRLLARVIGIGLETADMLVHKILSRDLRDRRAIARYAGLTGAPDESGKRRREKGLARAGNARVRYGMILLAWRFLQYQKDNALAQWFTAPTADDRGGTRKTMIVALARWVPRRAAHTARRARCGPPSAMATATGTGRLGPERSNCASRS